MKRFGSLRGNKKHKDPNRSTERRQSEPHGLFGRTLPSLSSPLPACTIGGKPHGMCMCASVCIPPKQ